MRRKQAAQAPPGQVALERVRAAAGQGETKFDLGGLGLDEVPEEVRTLPALRELWLGDNPFAAIPKEVWNLPRLAQLHMDGEQYAALPETLRKRAKPEIQVI